MLHIFSREKQQHRADRLSDDVNKYFYPYTFEPTKILEADKRISAKTNNEYYML